MARPKKIATPSNSNVPEETAAPVVSGAADSGRAEEVAAGLLTGEKGNSSTERVRAYRKRQKGESAKAAPEPLTEGDFADAAGLCETIWELAVVPFSGGRIRNVTGDQAERLGKVTAPLIAKYVPLLGDWQAEFRAAMVFGVIIRECYVAPEPNPKRTEVSEAEPATP